MYSGFCSSQAYLLADELSELRWLVASRSLSLRGICFGAVRVITTAGHRQARGVHSVSWAPKQSECPPPTEARCLQSPRCTADRELEAGQEVGTRGRVRQRLGAGLCLGLVSDTLRSSQKGHPSLNPTSPRALQTLCVCGGWGRLRLRQAQGYTLQRDAFWTSAIPDCPGSKQ